MKQWRTRPKSPRRVLKSSLLGYANSTSLHGISYLNDSSLGGGRVIWTIVCTTGFILTGLYVLRVYHEWKENPVLTHIQTTGKPISKMDYPAITICNQGWIDPVILGALLRQYRDFAAKLGVNQSGSLQFGNSLDLESQWRDKLYPGLKTHPLQLVKALASQDLERYARSQTLVDKGIDEGCIIKPECEPGWTKLWETTETPKKLFCVKNYGLSNFTHDKCTEVGATRMYKTAYDRNLEFTRSMQNYMKSQDIVSVGPTCGTGYKIGTKDLSGPFPFKWQVIDGDCSKECDKLGIVCTAYEHSLRGDGKTDCTIWKTPHYSIVQTNDQDYYRTSCLKEQGPQCAGGSVGSAIQGDCCSTGLYQCGVNEGDCDYTGSGQDCQPGLVCGDNNCPKDGRFDPNDDCCYDPSDPLPCGSGYEKTTSDLKDKLVADGGSQLWVLANDCASECDKRSGCTGYEYGIRDDGRQSCNTFTAPRSTIVKGWQQQSWASCLKKQGIIEKELIWTDEQCTPVGWFTKKCSDLCWETCQETAGCSAVNYSPTTGGCVLRQCALPVPEPTWSFPGYKGFTAKSDITGCPLVNKDLDGSNIRTVEVSSWQKCGQKCEEEPNCKGWTWATSSNGRRPNTCWIKDSISSAPIVTQKLISGQRGCKDYTGQQGSQTSPESVGGTASPTPIWISANWYTHYPSGSTGSKTKGYSTDSWIRMPMESHRKTKADGTFCGLAGYFYWERYLRSDVSICEKDPVQEGLNICMKEYKACSESDSNYLLAPDDTKKRKKRMAKSNDPGTKNENGDIDLSISTIDLAFNPELKEISKMIKAEILTYTKDQFGSLNMTVAYESLFEILWYTQLPCFDVRGTTSERDQQFSMLKSCYWRGRQTPCSDLFQTVSTDRGMCCSLNQMRATQMFTGKKFRDKVTKMQKRDQSLAFAASKNPTSSQKELMPWAGISNGLTVVLDARTDKVSHSSINDDNEGFFALVESTQSFPLLQKRSLLIPTGQISEIAVSPVHVTSGPNLKAAAVPEKRFCYFGDEYKLRLFRKYRQDNCKLECGIKFAQDQMNTTDLCHPWYLPTKDFQSLRMCSPKETFGFQYLMKSVPDSFCKHCLPDCTTTQYKTEISSSLFRRCDIRNLALGELCDFKSILDPPVWGSKMDNEVTDQAGTKPNWIKSGPSRRNWMQEEDSQEQVFKVENKNRPLYEAYEKDITVATFYFDSPTSYEYTREARMTIVEFISKVGGIAGVWIGFSLLSVVEMIYWLTIRLLYNP